MQDADTGAKMGRRFFASRAASPPNDTSPSAADRKLSLRLRVEDWIVFGIRRFMITSCSP
jgi:hypothetical protein